MCHSSFSCPVKACVKEVGRECDRWSGDCREVFCISCTTYAARPYDPTLRSLPAGTPHNVASLPQNWCQTSALVTMQSYLVWGWRTTLDTGGHYALVLVLNKLRSSSDISLPLNIEHLVDLFFHLPSLLSLPSALFLPCFLYFLLIQSGPKQEILTFRHLLVFIRLNDALNPTVE